MKTKIIKLDSHTADTEGIFMAAALLRAGEIVAFPTETVYGLGANAFDEQAVAKIFSAKGRPADNPMIVHVCDAKQLKEVVSEVPANAFALIKKFWPGPLTLVLKKSAKIPSNVTAGLDTVAVRMPSNKIALALIKECGFPIAAPSANTSGKPSPTTAQHVYDDLKGKIHLIIDGGLCEVGLESTVLDLTKGRLVILRPGKVTAEELEKVIGKIVVNFGFSHANTKEKPASPGMKYRHYSPKAELILVTSGKDFSEKVFELGAGRSVGVLSFSKEVGADNEFFFNENLDSYAKKLFAALRELDDRGVEAIIAEGVEAKGLGLAVMNRLHKAASKTV